MVKGLAIAALLLVGCKEKAPEKEAAPAARAPEPAPTPQGGVDDGLLSQEQIPPPPRPATVTDAHMAAAQKMIDAAIDAQKVVHAHTGDCEKSGADLAAVNARHAASIAEGEKTLAALKADGPATTYVTYHLSLERESRAAEVVALLELCKGHEGVRSAVMAFLPLAGMGGATGPALSGGGNTWSGPRPPDVTDEQVAAIDAMAAWFAQVIDVAKKAKGNCGVMAAEISRLAGQGKPIVARAKKLESAVEKGSAAETWLTNYGNQKIAPTVLLESIQPCMSDPAVQKVLETLGG